MIIDNAMYSWWCHPLAASDGTHLWYGCVERRGGNRVHRITGSTVDVVTLAGPTQGDEHNAPALAVDPAQDTVIAAYARHNADTHIRVQHVDRTSLALGTQQQLPMGGNVTYAQILHAGDTVHLLCRIDSERWVYRTSGDWGQTWGPAKALVDGGGGLFYISTRVDVADPDLVHLVTAGHPLHSEIRKIRYGRIRLDTGAVTKRDGTVLGNLGDTSGPDLAETDFDLVAAPSSSYRVRTLDVGVVGGQPAVAYVLWKPEDSSFDPVYKIKRWDGSDWDIPPWQLESGPIFGHTSGAHYHGGVGIGEDGATIRTSRKQGNDWIVEQWTWTGSTFTLDTEIARSRVRQIRPYAIRNSAGWLHQDCFYEGITRYYGDTVVS